MIVWKGEGGVVRVDWSAAANRAYVVLVLLVGEELIAEGELPRDEYIPMGRIQQAMWKSCDALFRAAAGVKSLNQEESHLLCIAKHRYLGRGFSVDGIRVRRFDPVMEIHMNNEALTKAIDEQGSLVGLAVKLIKETNRALPELARCISSSAYQNREILYGITFIHRGVERFGFSTYPIRNRVANRFLTWYLRNILRLTNPKTKTLADYRKDVLIPKIVAMSKDKLLAQFGETHDKDLQNFRTAQPSL